MTVNKLELVILSCHKCKKNVSFVIDKKGYERWMKGALIQNALPGLTNQEREMLITQMCIKCWKKMFED
tara:strand:+ start:230 stop:436 length:207 start_codon:yes stop_codon:yes gene_type:complete